MVTQLDKQRPYLIHNSFNSPIIIVSLTNLLKNKKEEGLVICICMLKPLGLALSEMFQQGLWVNPWRLRNCFEDCLDVEEMFSL